MKLLSIKLYVTTSSTYINIVLTFTQGNLNDKLVHVANNITETYMINIMLLVIFNFSSTIMYASKFQYIKTLILVYVFRLYIYTEMSLIVLNLKCNLSFNFHCEKKRSNPIKKYVFTMNSEFSSENVIIHSSSYLNKILTSYD